MFSFNPARSSAGIQYSRDAHFQLGARHTYEETRSAAGIVRHIRRIPIVHPLCSSRARSESHTPPSRQDRRSAAQAIAEEIRETHSLVCGPAQPHPPAGTAWSIGFSRRKNTSITQSCARLRVKKTLTQRSLREIAEKAARHALLCRLFVRSADRRSVCVASPTSCPAPHGLFERTLL
jgi:hypothetical protein